MNMCAPITNRLSGYKDMHLNLYTCANAITIPSTFDNIVTMSCRSKLCNKNYRILNSGFISFLLSHSPLHYDVNVVWCYNLTILYNNCAYEKWKTKASVYIQRIFSRTRGNWKTNSILILIPNIEDPILLKDEEERYARIIDIEQYEHLKYGPLEMHTVAFSRLKIKSSKQQAFCLLVACLTYPLALKTDVVRSSEMLNFYYATHWDI